MSSFFPARVPRLRTGKNDTIPEAPLARVAVTVNRRLDILQYEKKIIVFGSKSRLDVLQNEKQVPKNGILDATVDSQKEFKGSLREFV